MATKNVILATGSRPKSLPGITPDGKTILTSDEILQLKEIPKSLIVIGAGRGGHGVRLDVRPLRLRR